MSSRAERILMDLQLNPGARAQEISVRLGLPSGTVSEVLTTLKLAGQAFKAPIPKLQRRAWSRGWWRTGDTSPRRPLPIEDASPSARRAARLDSREEAIFAALAQGAQTSSEISAACPQIDRTGLYTLLHDLVADGLVCRDPAPKRTYLWRLAPDLETP